MIDLLQNAFHMAFTVPNVLALFFGVVVGVVIGAIPGMTGTMGVALALPFTFAMTPITGIFLLLGIYKGAIYGGSIPAILVRTPGTPAAACTVLDGFPLAQKGQAKKALTMGLYAACIADFISNVALILFTGVIAQLALRFGPPEYFALILFSLTIIAAVAGESLMRGLISAAIGLLLATIGMDLVYGTARLSFGVDNLLGGLYFIPVLIGLFALPEIIMEFGKRQSHTKDMSKVGNESLTWPEFRRCLPTTIRGSFIGVVLGAIPGIGAAPAAFLSYSEAHRTSPRRDNFGKGELEGVAASEAGNNGVCGATLIPLLALGVPGDIITAVILGAFMMHGLRPGPVLFVDHLDLIYGLFFGIMLSSIFLFITGKVAISGFAKIALVPNKLLYPAVIVLCFYGAYAVNTSMFAVLTMVVLGFLGLVMLYFKVPPAPFLIAFILGPMFENNLRRSLELSRGDLSIFFSSGIALFFLLLTVLSLGLVILRGVRARRARNSV